MFYVFTHHSSITPARFSCRDSGWSHGFKLGDQRTSLTPERDANCFTNWGGELSCAEARQLTSNRHSFPASLYFAAEEVTLWPSASTDAASSLCDGPPGATRTINVAS